MKIVAKKSKIESINADLVIIPLVSSAAKTDKGKKYTPWRGFTREGRTLLSDLEKKFDKRISRLVKKFDYSPSKEKRLDIPFPDENTCLRLSGLSEDGLQVTDRGLDEWRKLGGDAYESAIQQKASRFAVSLDSFAKPVQQLAGQAIVEGALLAQYDYDLYKKKERERKGQPRELLLFAKNLSNSLTADVVGCAKHRAMAVCLARDLVNCPASDMTPLSFVRAARRISKSSTRITCKVFNETALKKLKANALLGVARGSNEPAYLIQLSYKPLKKTPGQKRIVLIGKGVTFDSGGLSIKTGKGMETMKCDMAGAACVLAVMHYLSRLSGKNAIKHEIHALIPCTENMINGQSIKPGDIVRAINGKTIEVLNTDAEGRLILADALSYSGRIKPHIVIDLATLTGACIVALGSSYAGLFSNDEKLSESLQQHGHRAGENLWPMPLASEYQKLLKGSISDLKNIGSGGPGAITAALFLQEFIPDKAKWAHLDIAGPAFVNSSNEYIAKGGTGFGVRTLLSYLESL